LPFSRGPHPQTQKLKANETFGYSEAACCEPRRKNKGEMGDGILKEKTRKKNKIPQKPWIVVGHETL